MPDDNGLDFYCALVLLKAGRKVRRAAWDITDSVSTTALFMYEESIMENVGCGEHAYPARWVPKIEDILASDWEIHPDDRHVQHQDKE